MSTSQNNATRSTSCVTAHDDHVKVETVEDFICACCGKPATRRKTEVKEWPSMASLFPPTFQATCQCK